MTPAEHKAWFLGLPEGETQVALVDKEGHLHAVLQAYKLGATSRSAAIKFAFDLDYIFEKHRSERRVGLPYAISEKTGKAKHGDLDLMVVPFTAEHEQSARLRDLLLVARALLYSGVAGGATFQIPDGCEPEAVIAFFAHADQVGFLNQNHSYYPQLQCAIRAYEACATKDKESA